MNSPSITCLLIVMGIIWFARFIGWISSLTIRFMQDEWYVYTFWGSKQLLLSIFLTQVKLSLKCWFTILKFEELVILNSMNSLKPDTKFLDWYITRTIKRVSKLRFKDWEIVKTNTYNIGQSRWLSLWRILQTINWYKSL